MAKVLTIIENDPILGVKYGLVEVPETVIEVNQTKYAAAAYNATQACRHAKLTQQFCNQKSK